MSETCCEAWRTMSDRPRSVYARSFSCRSPLGPQHRGRSRRRGLSTADHRPEAAARTSGGGVNTRLQRDPESMHESARRVGRGSGIGRPGPDRPPPPEPRRNDSGTNRTRDLPPAPQKSHPRRHGLRTVRWRVVSRPAVAAPPEHDRRPHHPDQRGRFKQWTAQGMPRTM